MEKSCSVTCPQCSILSLGTYLKTYNFYGEAKVRYNIFIFTDIYDNLDPREIYVKFNMVLIDDNFFIMNAAVLDRF